MPGAGGGAGSELSSTSAPLSVESPNPIRAAPLILFGILYPGHKNATCFSAAFRWTICIATQVSHEAIRSCIVVFGGPFKKRLLFPLCRDESRRGEGRAQKWNAGFHLKISSMRRNHAAFELPARRPHA
jgi:hypothetical protein